MASNNPILLRFHNADGSTPLISPRALADLCGDLEAVADILIRLTGGTAKVRLMIDARPRLGCLEIPLVAEVAGAVSNLEIGDIWPVLFGGRSIFDLWQAAKPDPEAFPKELSIEATTAVLQDPAMTNALRKLVKQAAQCDADRVTICVRDSHETQLFPPLVPSALVIGRGFAAMPPSVMADGPVHSIRRRPGPVVNGLFDGKPAKFFMALIGPDAQSYGAVVAWLSAAEVPAVKVAAGVQGSTVPRKDQGKVDLPEMPAEFLDAYRFVRVDHALI